MQIAHFYYLQTCVDK